MIKTFAILIIVSIALSATVGDTALTKTDRQSVPPFSGTIFINGNIITASDPTTYQRMTYGGQANRLMFDRRINAFATYNAYLFNAIYADGLTIEMQVNPEFGSAVSAWRQCLRFAPAIGRIPRALRVDVETVWIHRGNNLFGGGNNNLLIHTEQADAYLRDGVLEEVFAHEAAHTSLDADHSAAPGWIAAQNADPNFISTYARDNPTREDIAESFLPYLAVTLRADRIPPSLFATIVNTIPNRIAYFNAQNFEMNPVVASGSSRQHITSKGAGDLQLAVNSSNVTT